MNQLKFKDKETGGASRLFTPFNEFGPVRKTVAVLAILFCIYSFLPAIKGIIGVGTFIPFMLGAFVLFVTFAWETISTLTNPVLKVLRAVIAVLLAAFIAFFAYISGEMIAASNKSVPINNNKVTVVVLGCKIIGTEPSKMLTKRLDAAAEYLLEHPEVNCIVSGGMGSDEIMPEAVVMKRYLIDKGVPASRIKTEDSSTSTFTNIDNSMQIIEANNYYSTICIVTDRFHQYRAAEYCNNAGIDSYALPCETPWYLTMYYWFREFAAIGYYKLIGVI